MPPIVLPPKEQSLFKRMNKTYEQKQYKSSLKLANQILANPDLANHGETLAFKGLVLFYLNKKEEAHEFVKKGIKNDLQSGVCWHVYCIIHREERNYEQALKCCRSALKFTPDSQQVMRDLAILQIHVRDIDGYVASRHKLLQAFPLQRNNWIGYSVALHLSGRYDQALKVLDQYRKFHEDQKSRPEDTIETSELALYKAMILEEKGAMQEALDLLIVDSDVIGDKVSLCESLARLYLSLGEHAQAESVYRLLLSRNVEHAAYYQGLEKALGLTTPEKEADRLALYKAYSVEYPRATAPRLLPLSFASSSAFRPLVAEYLSVNIKKGVIPLFRHLKGLYSSPEKVAIIEDVVGAMEASLKETGALAKGEAPEPITSLLWVLYYLAQHHYAKGDYPRALSVVTEALDHTPTMLELYLLKAKILQKLGDIGEAANAANAGRELDTADRYVNSKCVKYMLRAGDIAPAEEIAATFIKDTVDAMSHLKDMQACWFTLEEAKAYHSLGKIGRALKKIHELEGYFATYTNDQFDFHSYCLRKATFRSYVRMVRYEDVIHEHKYYVRAAVLGAKIYLALHETPFVDDSKTEEEKLLASMTDAERKKYESKKRREEAKKKSEGEKPAPASSSSTSAAPADDKKPKDEDPEGLALVKTTTPLDAALKLLKPVLAIAKKSIDVHLTAFEVHFCRGQRPLLLLQSLRRASAIDAAHPSLHVQLARYGVLLEGGKLQGHASALTVAAEEFGKLTGGKKMMQFNDEYLASHKDSYPHALAVAEALYVLNAKDLPRAVKLISSFSDATKGCTVQTCIDGYGLLKKMKAADADIAAFKTACHARFPLAKFFQ